MERQKKSEDDAKREPKSARWKVEIARELRAKTTASNRWIAGHLAMGHPTRVCNLINQKM